MVTVYAFLLDSIMAYSYFLILSKLAAILSASSECYAYFLVISSWYALESTFDLTLISNSFNAILTPLSSSILMKSSLKLAVRMSTSSPIDFFMSSLNELYLRVFLVLSDSIVYIFSVILCIIMFIFAMNFSIFVMRFNAYSTEGSFVSVINKNYLKIRHTADLLRVHTPMEISKPWRTILEESWFSRPRMSTGSGVSSWLAFFSYDLCIVWFA